MLKKRLRNVWTLTVAGMPEWALFPSDEARHRAFSEVSEWPRRPKRAIGTVFVVVPMLIVFFGARWLLFDVITVPRFVSVPLYGLVLVATLFIALRWLHCWALGPDLREKLLECGVPVCLKCGYLLSGLSLESACCPECGTTFGDRARALITSPTVCP